MRGPERVVGEPVGLHQVEEVVLPLALPGGVGGEAATVALYAAGGGVIGVGLLVLDGEGEEDGSGSAEAVHELGGDAVAGDVHDAPVGGDSAHGLHARVPLLLAAGGVQEGEMSTTGIRGAVWSLAWVRARSKASPRPAHSLAGQTYPSGMAERPLRASTLKRDGGVPVGGRGGSGHWVPWTLGSGFYVQIMST